MEPDHDAALDGMVRPAGQAARAARRRVLAMFRRTTAESYRKTMTLPDTWTLPTAKPFAERLRLVLRSFPPEKVGTPPPPPMPLSWEVAQTAAKRSATDWQHLESLHVEARKKWALSIQAWTHRARLLGLQQQDAQVIAWAEGNQPAFGMLVDTLVQDPFWMDYCEDSIRIRSETVVFAAWAVHWAYGGPTSASSTSPTRGTSSSRSSHNTHHSSSSSAGCLEREMVHKYAAMADQYALDAAALARGPAVPAEPCARDAADAWTLVKAFAAFQVVTWYELDAVERAVEVPWLAMLETARLKRSIERGSERPQLEQVVFSAACLTQVGMVNMLRANARLVHIAARLHTVPDNFVELFHSLEQQRLHLATKALQAQVDKTRGAVPSTKPSDSPGDSPSDNSPSDDDEATPRAMPGAATDSKHESEPSRIPEQLLLLWKAYESVPSSLVRAVYEVHAALYSVDASTFFADDEDGVGTALLQRMLQDVEATQRLTRMLERVRVVQGITPPPDVVEAYARGDKAEVHRLAERHAADIHDEMQLACHDLYNATITLHALLSILLAKAQDLFKFGQACIEHEVAEVIDAMTARVIDAPGRAARMVTPHVLGVACRRLADAPGLTSEQLATATMNETHQLLREGKTHVGARGPPSSSPSRGSGSGSGSAPTDPETFNTLQFGMDVSTVLVQPATAELCASVRRACPVTFQPGASVFAKAFAATAAMPARADVSDLIIDLIGVSHAPDRALLTRCCFQPFDKAVDMLSMMHDHVMGRALLPRPGAERWDIWMALLASGWMFLSATTLAVLEPRLAHAMEGFTNWQLPVVNGYTLGDIAVEKAHDDALAAGASAAANKASNAAADTSPGPGKSAHTTIGTLTEQEHKQLYGLIEAALATRKLDVMAGIAVTQREPAVLLLCKMMDWTDAHIATQFVSIRTSSGSEFVVKGTVLLETRRQVLRDTAKAKTKRRKG